MSLKYSGLSSLFLAAAALLAAPVAQAQRLPYIPAAAQAGPAATCWQGAANYHGVDVWLLYSVAWVESNMRPSQIGKNKNGTLDLGMMQINTIWLPQLARYGISREQLLDGCTSIYVGAWIMSKNIRSMGYNWRAIGAYNSRTPSIGYRYALKVYEAHSRFTGMPTIYQGSAPGITQASTKTGTPR